MRTDNVSIIERVAAISETKCSKKGIQYGKFPLFSPLSCCCSLQIPLYLSTSSRYLHDPWHFAEVHEHANPLKLHSLAECLIFPQLLSFSLSLSISHSYLVKKTEALGFL